MKVSQFTLYANLWKGNKPDFHGSMRAEESRVLYTSFVDQLRSGYTSDSVKGLFALPFLKKDGRFQTKMEVSIVNDGPVTLVIDSKKPGSLEVN